MIYGYVCMSTEDQDLAEQLAGLAGAGCDRVFVESVVPTAKRPQLKKLMAEIANGDVLVIPSLDCVSFDITDLLVTACDLQNAGAGLRSLAEPVVDTTSDHADVVLAILGVVARLQRRRGNENSTRGRMGSR